MNIPSAGISGYQLISQSTQQINRAGGEIAQAPIEKTAEAAPSRPLEQSLVSLKEAEIGAQAGVKIIEAVENNIGTLIDIEV